MVDHDVWRCLSVWLIRVYRRLTSEEESVRLAAAKEWTRWEMATSKLFPDTLNIDKAEDAK